MARLLPIRELTTPPRAPAARAACRCVQVDLARLTRLLLPTQRPRRRERTRCLVDALAARSRRPRFAALRAAQSRRREAPARPRRCRLPKRRRPGAPAVPLAALPTVESARPSSLFPAEGGPR